MAKFMSISSATSIPRTSSTPSPLPLRPLSAAFHSKVGLRWRVKCMTSPDTKPDTQVPASSPPPSSSSPASPGLSSYSWSAALGGLGFVETAYLTYLKLTNSTAFCPLGGGIVGDAGGCADILGSDYSLVFGVPLPLLGMASYGFVAALALQLSKNSLPFGFGASDSRTLLLGATTSLAATSGYLLYILTTQFPGQSCPYCLFSAFISFSLFLITVKELGWQETQKVLGLQLCIASLVIASLRFSYGAPLPFTPRQPEINLEYIPTEITTPSAPFTISLAKHLRSIGARMYGAFWCSHCIEQKEMFGEEAAKLLNYVECFPDGLNKNTKMALECVAADIKGFPTWVINGEVLNGELTLSELAQKSGFELSDNGSSSVTLMD
ncbi:unnamed protein product [Linum tenue]|uniref:Vitamin K epoxide reductase domain-containing protein n=1 Tax=Linum tenue TaxID=586396 RepID=A0AAV0NRQ7_9ROSI|nr:unnamed protein product [Linum tenue]